MRAKLGIARRRDPLLRFAHASHIATVVASRAMAFYQERKLVHAARPACGHPACVRPELSILLRKAEHHHRVRRIGLEHLFEHLYSVRHKLTAHSVYPDRIAEFSQGCRSCGRRQSRFADDLLQILVVDRAIQISVRIYRNSFQRYARK